MSEDEAVVPTDPKPRKTKRHSKASDGHKKRASDKTKVHPETEWRLREVFEQCDVGEDGSINKREFILVMRNHPDIADFFHLPHNIRQEDGSRDAMERLFQEIDDNHDREITWEELLNHVSLFSSSLGEDSVDEQEEDSAALRKGKQRKTKVNRKSKGGEDETGHEPATNNTNSKSSKHRSTRKSKGRPPSEWAVYEAFPRGKDDRIQRNTLFDSIDVTGEGSLIQEELEKGLIRQLNMPESAQSLVARGFDLVRVSELGPSGTISVIDKKGFRSILEYVSHTFEVMDAFQATSDSTITPERAIDIRNLAAASSGLATLGVQVKKGREMDIFDRVDPRHDGTVILADFCDWVAKDMINMDRQTRRELTESRSLMLAGRIPVKPAFPSMPSLSDLVKKDPDVLDPSWQQQLRKDASEVDAIGDDFRRLVVTMEQKAHDMKLVLYEVFKDPWTALQEPSAPQLLDDVSAKLIDMQNDLKQIRSLKECLKGSNLVECQRQVVDTLRASQSLIESFLAFQAGDAKQILNDRRGTAEKYVTRICESEHMLKKLQSGVDVTSLISEESQPEQLVAQQKTLDSSHKMIQYFLAVVKPHLGAITVSSKSDNLSKEVQVGIQFLAQALGPAVHEESSQAKGIGKRMKKTASRKIGRAKHMPVTHELHARHI